MNCWSKRDGRKAVALNIFGAWRGYSLGSNVSLARLTLGPNGSLVWGVRLTYIPKHGVAPETKKIKNYKKKTHRLAGLEPQPLPLLSLTPSCPLRVPKGRRTGRFRSGFGPKPSPASATKTTKKIREGLRRGGMQPKPLPPKTTCDKTTSFQLTRGVWSRSPSPFPQKKNYKTNRYTTKHTLTSNKYEGALPNGPRLHICEYTQPILVQVFFFLC